MRLPDAPNLEKGAAEAAATAPPEDPRPLEPVPDLPPVPDAPEAWEELKEPVWTPDRIVSIGLMVLFAVFAVGLVVSLARWDVLVKVPFVPWLVGAAIVAGPAWKSYTDVADEVRETRASRDRAKHAFGIAVKAPRDRHQG